MARRSCFEALAAGRGDPVQQDKGSSLSGTIRFSLKLAERNLRLRALSCDSVYAVQFQVEQLSHAQRAGTWWQRRQRAIHAPAPRSPRGCNSGSSPRPWHSPRRRRGTPAPCLAARTNSAAGFASRGVPLSRSPTLDLTLRFDAGRFPADAGSLRPGRDDNPYRTPTG